MVNFLYSFIINYKAVHKSSLIKNYIQFETDQNKDKMLFIDW